MMDRPRFGLLEATHYHRSGDDAYFGARCLQNLLRQVTPLLALDLPCQTTFGPLITADTETERTWSRRAVCLLLRSEDAAVGDFTSTADFGQLWNWERQVLDLGGGVVVRAWERVG